MGKQKVTPMDEALLARFPSDPKNILFVCTGNSCRSVYAEGIFREMIEKEGLEIQVHSAGTEALPGKKASPLTLEYLQREAIDLNNHSTQKITPEKIEEADIIFVMENRQLKKILSLSPQAAEKIFLLAQFYPRPEILPQGTEIPDPMGMYNFFHENVNEIIRLCCERVFGALKKARTPSTILLEERR